MVIDALEWLGHSGFRISVRRGTEAGPATVYVDPYRTRGGPPADLILVTHGHYDHFSPRDIEVLAGQRTRLVAPAAVAERLSGRVASIAPSESFESDEVHGVSVRAVPAYNTSKRDADGRPFHPREAGWVGYELNVWGERVYHAGDTDVIPEMDLVAGCDVALLPVSGTYVMTPAEAAEAARRIGPRIAVPMHWGEHIGDRADAEEFARLSPVETRILERAGG